MIALFIALAIPFPDDLPDNHVERWLQVTVRDDVIHFRYAIGFNDTTLASLLKDHDLSDVSADAESQREALKTALEPFEKIRKAVGDKIDIMCEKTL